MKDLHHQVSPTIKESDEKPSEETVEGTTSLYRNVDAATMKKNPKIDARLVSDFYRLVDASKGVIRGARGANYRLSHPLGSNDVPTYPSQIGKSQRAVKKS